jgi:hypothetical protein
MRSGLPCTILAAVAEHEREAISAVAPFTGVRIETSWRAITRSSSAVAPFTGGADRNRQPSPSREADRGRSLHGGADRNISSGSTSMARSKVAPFTGARIETFAQLVPPIIAKSLPSRGRGSKRCRRRLGTEHLESLPSRGRGSKQHGARIPAAQSAGRSLHGGADRNPIAQLITASTLVAPFTGGSPLAPRGEWW